MDDTDPPVTDEQPLVEWDTTLPPPGITIRMVNVWTDVWTGAPILNHRYENGKAATQ